MNTMHPRTTATVQELKEAQWFRCAGVNDTETVEILSSWYEAVESCSSPEWEELSLEATNQYCERLAQRSPERFKKWNDIASELRPVVQKLVGEKAARVIEENDLPEIFIDTVNWDILGLLMEAEFADVLSPGWYTGQAYWYLNGHFPCGWRGTYPKGKLVVF
jgi:hypothetical protein